MKLVRILWKTLVVLLAVYGISLYVKHEALKYRGGYNLSRAQELADALFWLKQHVGPQETILSTWEQSAQVAAYTGRKVIATCKVYPSETVTVAQRYRDISRFFFAQNEADALAITSKYGVTYVLVPRKMHLNLCQYINACAARLSRYALRPESRQTTLVGLLLDRKPLKHFSLAFQNRTFFIYRVKE